MKQTHLMALISAATTLYLHGYEHEAKRLDQIVEFEEMMLETKRDPAELVALAVKLRLNAKDPS